MHGPRVSEEELAAERAVWERDREELKRERGARQMALYREWQAQIRARVAARIEPQQAAWTRRAQETIDAQKAEAERLQKEAQSRNADEMERVLKEREENSAAAKRALRLAAVRNEADALEARCAQPCGETCDHAPLFSRACISGGERGSVSARRRALCCTPFCAAYRKYGDGCDGGDGA